VNGNTRVDGMIGIGVSPLATLHMLGSLRVDDINNVSLFNVLNNGQVGLGIIPFNGFRMALNAYDLGGSHMVLYNANIGGDTWNINVPANGNAGSMMPGSLTFRNNAINRFVISNTGNVGIGIDSPTNPLTIKGDNTGIITAFNDLGGSALVLNNNGTLVLGSGVLNSQLIISGAGPNAGIYSPSYSSSNTNIINFKNFNGNIGMTLDITNPSYGLLGINTTTPSAVIHIKGSGSTNATYTAKFENTLGNPSLYIQDDGNIGIGNAPIAGYKTYINAGNQAGMLVNTSGDIGVYSISTSAYAAVLGVNNTATSIQGNSVSGVGVSGAVTGTGIGLLGDSNYGIGIKGTTYTGTGLEVLQNNFTITSNSNSNTAYIHRETILNGFDMTGSVLKINDNTLSTGHLVQIQKGGIDKLVITSIGLLKYIDGNQASGKILTSDSNGVATWQNAPASGPSGSGTTNYLTKWSNSTTLTNSIVYETSQMIHINGTVDNGSTPQNTKLNIHSSNTGPNYDTGFCFSDSVGNWPTSIRQINNSLYIDLSGGGPTQAFGTAFKLKPVGSGTCALTIGGDVDGNLITNALFSVRNKDYAGASSTIQSNNDTGYSSQDFYVNTSTNTMNNLGSLTAYAFNINPILNNVFSLYATSLASNMYFDDRSSGGLVFGTGGSRRSIINSSANWGINTLAPTAQLHVVGNSSISAAYTAKFDNGSANPSLYIRDDGSVSLGIDPVSMPGAQFPLLIKTTGVGNNLLFLTNGNIGRMHLGTSEASNYFESLNNSFTFWKGGVGGNTTTTNHLFTIGANGRTSFVNDSASSDYQNHRFYIEHNNADSNPQTALFVNNIVTTTSSPVLYAGRLETVGVSGKINIGILANATGGASNYAIVVPLNGGSVGIGTSLPTNTLHLVGSFKYVDGNQSVGKILTSDANGVASWQSGATSSSGTVNKYSTTFTPGTASVPNTITHNLSTTDIITQLWDLTSGEIIYAKVNNRTNTSVDVTFTSNPSGDVRIVIMA
jgi:hypothetical protein